MSTDHIYEGKCLGLVQNPCCPSRCKQLISAKARALFLVIEPPKSWASSDLESRLN